MAFVVLLGCVNGERAEMRWDGMGWDGRRSLEDDVIDACAVCDVARWLAFEGSTYIHACVNE